MKTETNITRYRPRLAIHVVWHPGFKGGQEIAESIYAHFTRDPKRPNARGIGIPVYYRSAAAAGSVPAPIEMESAEHTVVVVLVDTQMLLHRDDGWSQHLSAVLQAIDLHPLRHRLFPVALHERAYGFFPAFSELNFIRLQNLDPAVATQSLLNALTNELGRLLTQRPAITASQDSKVTAGSPAKMRLFISHAKQDGLQTATALRNYINKNFALDTFFDTLDIASGFRFKDEIDGGIDSTAVLVIQTDSYASRVWCQYEVIRAKRKGRPVVVVHAIEEGEARSFPYIGNVPTIRWRPNEDSRIDAVVGLLLREVLRTEYFQRHVEDLKMLLPADMQVRALPRAPELLTCLALRAVTADVSYFIYPDPPLARQELDILTELDPRLRLTTPTMLFAHPSDPRTFAGHEIRKVAAGWRVGLSISDSPDLAVRGFGAAHLADAAAEFARFLLAGGASISYGGDLRQGGFSEVLFELVASYHATSDEPTEVVNSYLAWPLSLDLTDEQQVQLLSTARFHKVPPPADLGVDPAVKLPPSTPENRWVWARCLTAMRELMNQKIDARIFLGGPPGRSKGKYPGLVEEALYALRAKKPVFLIGAFGGCTQVLIDAICKKKPDALTLAFQSQDPADSAAIVCYNAKGAARGEAIDYPDITAFFENAGIAGLNNGLTEEENLRLFTTTHLPEMIALVLRGLSRLGSRPTVP